MQTFVPLVGNAHLLTVAASYWPRYLDERRFRVEANLFRTEPEVQILVHSQRPDQAPRGELVLLHGLEGSSNSGYMRSAAQAALEMGFVTHRLNHRSCGGTEFLCHTFYHSGLTSDLLAFLLDLDRRGRTPVFLAGYSLGGNVALKLAGELGGDAHRLLAGVCAMSAPIDLAACVRRLHEPANRLYEWWFLHSMKRRLRLRHRVMPDQFPAGGLAGVSSVFEFDDRFTAPPFGFRGAADYYETQSACRFLDRVRVPTLVVQAQDDPMIPFETFRHPAFAANPALRLMAVAHGGHLGFVSRRAPRFWADRVLLSWMLETLNK